MAHLAYYNAEVASIMNKEDLAMNFSTNYQGRVYDFDPYYKNNARYKPCPQSEYQVLPNLSNGINPEARFSPRNNIIRPTIRYSEVPIHKTFDRNSPMFLTENLTVQENLPERRRQRKRPYNCVDISDQTFSETNFSSQQYGKGSIGNLEQNDTNGGCRSSRSVGCNMNAQQSSGESSSQNILNIYPKELPIVQAPIPGGPQKPQVLPPGFKVYNITVEKTESGYQMSAPNGLSFTEEDISNLIKAATTGETIFKPRPKSRSSDFDRTPSQSSSYSDLATHTSNSSMGSCYDYQDIVTSRDGTQSEAYRTVSLESLQFASQQEVVLEEPVTYNQFPHENQIVTGSMPNVAEQIVQSNNNEVLVNRHHNHLQIESNISDVMIPPNEQAKNNNNRAQFIKDNRNQELTELVEGQNTTEESSFEDKDKGGSLHNLSKEAIQSEAIIHLAASHARDLESCSM